VQVATAIGLAAVADLAGAYAMWRGGAVRALLGGGPEHRPERYAVADPMAVAPLAIPVLLVHGTRDRTVSIDLARRYARRSLERGGECELLEIEGEAGAHRAHLDPRGQSWAGVVGRLGEPSAVA
jgi:pimeloyl-ACP methyl ester carboxylesterase